MGAVTTRTRRVEGERWREIDPCQASHLPFNFPFPLAQARKGLASVSKKGPAESSVPPLSPVEKSNTCRSPRACKSTQHDQVRTPRRPCALAGVTAGRGDGDYVSRA
jgi:hypothetical protein